MESGTSTLTGPVGAVHAAALVDEVATLVEGFVGELVARVAAVVETADDRQMATLLGAVEQAQRGAEAAAVAVVDAVDRRALYLADGHRHTKGWVLASVRVSAGEATRRVRLACLVRNAPQVADQLATGTLGLAHAGELARAMANPRVGTTLLGAVDDLLGWARNDDFDTFASKVRELERLVDADGAHRGADAAHADRDVRLSTVGDVTYLDGRFGNLQGDVMRQILDAFADAEFAADWDDATARFGDAACAGLLARSAGQRRADALYAIFVAAAGAPLAGKDIDLTVNIVVDQATFEEQLADLVDPFHQHRHTTATTAGERCGFDPDAAADTVTGRFCRTTSGAAVDPVAAAVAGLIGHVRRVVIGGDGVIVDLGRRVRCFTGSTRHAAILQAGIDGWGRCRWPGCRLTHIQIDHTIEWAHGGTTRIGNAGLLCRHHNVIKTRGYTTRRDPDGRWHTHRPDGTEIVAA